MKCTIYTLALAFALPCAVAWAIDLQGGASAPPAPPDLAQPNAQNPVPPDRIPANPAQPNAAPANADQPNPAPANPAQPNPAPPDQVVPPPAQPNPVPANPVPPNPGQQNLTQPNSAPATTAPPAPVFFSPLQEFLSKQVNEVGTLSDQIDQFKAAKRPDVVLALYHMIRDHTLMADAARNVLARRGDAATPTSIVTPPMSGTPEEIIHRDLQAHQQALSDVQQLLSNASAPEDKAIYQRAVDATNRHMSWLSRLDQGQRVQIGFFDPTTPLGQLAGPASVATASATGYPQPMVSRTAGYRQGVAPRRSTRHRRYRRGRYAAYRRVRRAR